MDFVEFYDSLDAESREFLDSLGDGTYYEELTTYEPTEDSDVYNASDAMEWFEFQGDTSRCAQYAQLFVIEEFTGYAFDMNEFAAFAEANGWFSEDYGTDLEDMNKMLDYFGIENYPSYASDFSDLLTCLENDGRVIVAVDSGEYWYNEGFIDDMVDPYGMDHAIEVIGYDAETNMVIVNDSGVPDGAGLEIPLDTFLNAWADSDNFMIECYNS